MDQEKELFNNLIDAAEKYDDYVAEHPEVTTEPEPEGSSINWKIVGGLTAAAGIGAGVVAKKFGPGIRKKYLKAKAERLAKKQQKLEKKQLDTQVKLNNLSTPEPEATKEA